MSGNEDIENVGELTPITNPDLAVPPGPVIAEAVERYTVDGRALGFTVIKGSIRPAIFVQRGLGTKVVGIKGRTANSDG